MKKSTQPKTRLVPEVVFKRRFVGVVPICVAAACGGETASSQPPPGASSVGATAFADSGDESASLTVAAIGFDAGPGPGSVAAVAFDSSVFRPPGVADSGFGGGADGVADVAFLPDALDAGPPRDAGDADSHSFTVANIGFDVASDAFGIPEGESG